MPKKPKTFPLIVLVHGPKVIYTGCIKRTADKSLCKSTSYQMIQIRLGMPKISSYDVPTYIVSWVSAEKVHTSCSLT